MNYQIKTFDGRIVFEAATYNLKECLEQAIANRVYLRRTYLRGADLSGAEGINKYFTTPMYILLEQNNPLRAYKIVNEKNEGIYNGGLVYLLGERIEVADYSTNELEQCGAGINLASLDWCIKEWKKGYKILVCEFQREDLICIPISSDGKFRVKACMPVRELDLAEYGIVEA